MSKHRNNPLANQVEKNRNDGAKQVASHPLFAPLIRECRLTPSAHCPESGWAVVTSAGELLLHPKRLATPEEWAYVMAHCLLHLGLNHIVDMPDPKRWNAACDAVATEFLRVSKIGRPIANLGSEWRSPSMNEHALYERFGREGIPDELKDLGTAGAGHVDFMRVNERPSYYASTTLSRAEYWQKLFARGLSAAVQRAVAVAGGEVESMASDIPLHSEAQRAKAWFISHYPLLGAMAASFHIIEDADTCERMDISIAAVHPELKEIYMNPKAGLGESECRFVMAHELLHVGLRHDIRCQGRDPYLWNVACDYVINGWLVEMDVGTMPTRGCLYDPALKGLSAESIYDQIAKDMRKYRKLATLAGVGVGDVIARRDPDWWFRDGMTLDEFYRSCMMQGLEYHYAAGRGTLPGDFVEEIRALAHPPLPWDVELAKWFDEHFAPAEKRRTYARPSRRQSSTPDIPRPSWVPRESSMSDRTFGVVLDTSGSMDRVTLARGLGAIASYSMSREVPAVRLVFCDVHAHDEGYVLPETILDRVKIKGRGGTRLQPGIDLLQRAEDFPKEGPILVITDGLCDRITVSREHAFLMPMGTTLPFPPRGPVFRITKIDQVP